MDNKITLQQLADALADRCGLKRRKAESFVRAFFEVTESALLQDGIVKAKGFGTTKIVTVNDRESVNISTGQRFQIDGHAKISFTPDPTFRDLVNRPFAHFSTTILEDDVQDEELVRFDAPAALPADIEEPAIEEPSVDEPTFEGTIFESPAVEEPGFETPEDIELPDKDEMPEPIAEYHEEANDNDATVEEENTEDTVEAVAPETSEEEEYPEAEDDIETEETDDYNEVVDTETDTTSQTAEEEESEANTLNQDEDMQPIIINNTIPGVTPINRWRTAFCILSTVVLMVLSYFAGYYRWFCPCEFTSAQPSTPVTTASAANENANETTSSEASTASRKPAVKNNSKDASPAADTNTDKNNSDNTTADTKIASVSDTKPAATTKEPQLTPEQKAQQEAKRIRKAAESYEQPGGDYLITGVLELHEMKEGENLYKIARRTYGDKELARYIISHNHISNPDLVQIGAKIEIPQLTKKP